MVLKGESIKMIVMTNDEMIIAEICEQLKKKRFQLIPSWNCSIRKIIRPFAHAREIGIPKQTSRLPPEVQTPKFTITQLGRKQGAMWHCGFDELDFSRVNIFKKAKTSSKHTGMRKIFFTSHAPISNLGIGKVCFCVPLWANFQQVRATKFLHGECNLANWYFRISYACKRISLNLKSTIS